ncbi:MAG TPA: hypothetical protein VEC18_10650 [Myxococcota bacterium]|nr:hypothetical protein [Myxococcota bacterium]
MIAAHAIITTVSRQLTYPCVAVAGFRVSGQKLPTMFIQPALSVVAATKSIGTTVTHA